MSNHPHGRRSDEDGRNGILLVDVPDVNFDRRRGAAHFRDIDPDAQQHVAGRARGESRGEPAAEHRVGSLCLRCSVVVADLRRALGLSRGNRAHQHEADEQALQPPVRTHSNHRHLAPPPSATSSGADFAAYSLRGISGQSDGRSGRVRGRHRLPWRSIVSRATLRELLCEGGGSPRSQGRSTGGSLRLDRKAPGRLPLRCGAASDPGSRC